MSPIGYALAGMLALVGATWGYGLWLPPEVNGSATATCQVQPIELR
jgi:hypothetical protein